MRMDNTSSRGASSWQRNNTAWACGRLGTVRRNDFMRHSAGRKRSIAWTTCSVTLEVYSVLGPKFIEISRGQDFERPSLRRAFSSEWCGLTAILAHNNGVARATSSQYRLQKHYASNADFSFIRTLGIVLLRVTQDPDDKDRRQEFARETEDGRLQPYGLFQARL